MRYVSDVFDGENLKEMQCVASLMSARIDAIYKFIFPIPLCAFSLV